MADIAIKDRQICGNLNDLLSLLAGLNAIFNVINLADVETALA